MQDCRVALEVRGGKGYIQAENVSLEELATLSGYLQHMAGVEACRQGMSLDDVRGSMLDIHLAAMETVIREVRSGNSGETI